MCGVAEMRGIREAVGAYTLGFDPALVTGADAERIVEDVVAAKNMLATLEALASRRASEAGVWRQRGDASPAHHLARVSGTTLGKAREALDTAARLAGLPAVEAAARRGELSPAQAAPIADAASKAPGAERRLLAAAKGASLGELLDTCARTKAAAEPDDEARHRAIHASRFLRRRRTTDGAGELHYRSTLDEVAEIFAIVQGWADRRFKAARAAGRHEPGEAYLADGLLAAVRASRVSAAGGGGGTPGAAADEPDAGTGAAGTGAAGTGAAGTGAAGTGAAGTGAGGQAPRETGADDEARPHEDDAPTVHFGDEDDAPTELFGDEAAPRTPAASPRPASPAAHGPDTVDTPPARPPRPVKVIVRIDMDALVRGWPIDGELSEIAGFGPIAVAAVRAMIASGNVFLAAVVTKGVDVVNVAHLGRRPTAHQQTGLEWRSPECTTVGCNVTVRLENDHREQWADTKVTLLAWLDPLCGCCHDKKTYKGWALVEGTGKRPLVPPDDPRHPRNARKGPEAADSSGAA